MSEKTFKEVVREYFPDASDEDVEFILWERTGYPSFWRIPKDGASSIECLRKQLSDYKREVKDGTRTNNSNK